MVRVASSLWDDKATTTTTVPSSSFARSMSCNMLNQPVLYY